MPDEKNQFLDKVPIDKIYEDLFQPGLKRTGVALETVIEFGSTILLPLKLVSEKARLRLKSNLDKYEKKLNSIEETKICAVPEQIGLPIIDKLTYLNNDTLSDGFINLLTKASSVDTINLVHPAFLFTLENLSSDEAKILKHYKDFNTIPFIDLNVKKFQEKIPKPDFYDTRGPKTKEQLKKQLDYAYQDRGEINLKAGSNLTGIEISLLIDFPKNIDIYLENLSKLGIISFERDRYNNGDVERYQRLEQMYSSQIDEVKGFAAELTGEYKMELFVSKGFISFTEFGRAFVEACIKE